jgi:hypothetical protein
MKLQPTQKKFTTKNRYSGAVTFWEGSGSLDPYTGLRIRIRIRLQNLLFS